MNIDVEHVRRMMNEKIKELFAVHYGGLPCDLDELHKIAREWNIPVIEGAAHAAGAPYRGKHIGEILKPRNAS